MAGSGLDETVGDSGGRLHVSRSGSKQTTGARTVTAVSYSNVKQSICDGDEQYSGSREGAGKHCGFPEAPDLLISIRQRASGLRYPFKRQLELASRDLGTTAFAAAQVGEHCGARPLQWRVGHQPAPVPTKNSAASLP
jgi:hypothetical protein